MVRRGILVIACATAATLLSASAAFALVNSSTWYTYYAPGGWTYNAANTSRYNCMAYALGYTDRWIWPSWAGFYVTDAEMDIEMEIWGRYPTSSGSAKIITYGYAGDVRHFGKVTSGTQTVAKWGQLERFAHPWFPYRKDSSNKYTYGGLRKYYK